MSRQERARSATPLMWGEKVKWMSRVTTKILGDRQRGKVFPSVDTDWSSRDLCVSYVNRVQLLLLMETWRPRSAAQWGASAAGVKQALRGGVDIVVGDDRVKSSAQELWRSAVWGQSATMCRRSAKDGRGTPCQFSACWAHLGTNAKM